MTVYAVRNKETTFVAAGPFDYAALAAAWIETQAPNDPTMYEILPVRDDAPPEPALMVSTEE